MVNSHPHDSRTSAPIIAVVTTFAVRPTYGPQNNSQTRPRSCAHFIVSKAKDLGHLPGNLVVHSSQYITESVRPPIRGTPSKPRPLSYTTQEHHSDHPSATLSPPTRFTRPRSTHTDHSNRRVACNSRSRWLHIELLRFVAKVIDSYVRTFLASRIDSQ